MKQSEWLPKHVVCVILKDTSTVFTKKYAECKNCNSEKGLER